MIAASRMTIPAWRRNRAAPGGSSAKRALNGARSRATTIDTSAAATKTMIAPRTVRPPYWNSPRVMNEKAAPPPRRMSWSTSWRSATTASAARPTVIGRRTVGDMTVSSAPKRAAAALPATSTAAPSTGVRPSASIFASGDDSATNMTRRLPKRMTGSRQAVKPPTISPTSSVPPSCTARLCDRLSRANCTPARSGTTKSSVRPMLSTFTTTQLLSKVR